MKFRAFTLIELIVAIGIIAMLIGVATPVFSGIRLSSIENKSLANMRSHSNVLQVYALDHREVFPFVTHPDADFTVLRGGGETVQTGFFGANEFWFIALTDSYYDSSLDPDLFTYPGVGGNIYLYSSAMFTSPDFWNIRTRNSATRDQWRSVRVGQVRYPSSKVSFTEFRTRKNATVFPIWSNFGKVIKGDRFGFGFTDGSARRPLTGKLTLPYQGGDGGGPQSRLGEIGVSGVHTVDGIFGRDVMN